MKICIWYKTTNRPWGGSNSFLKSLATQFCKKGHVLINRPHISADVILINSWTLGAGRLLSPKMIIDFKKYGTVAHYHKYFPFVHLFRQKEKKYLPLIHRLDGIAALYGRFDKADVIQFEINKLTDYTIFQSEFCRQSFLKFNVTPQNSTVIYNGVDNSIYFPAKKPKGLGQTLKALAVSWSSNPKKGFETLVNVADLSNIELTFIGNWCNSIQPGKIKLLGVKTASEIAEVMRQNDIFIHAAENDPCPNVVLEALASGLPILYKDSGGTTELARNYGLPILSDINESIEEIKDKYVDLRIKVLHDLHLFSIEYAANKYLKVLEEVKGNHTDGYFI